MASRKEQKEQLRAERLEREAAEQAKQRRQRLVQYGSAAAFLAICAVAVLIVVSQTGGGAAGGGARDAALGPEQLPGLPHHGALLGAPEGKGPVVGFGRPPCPRC